MRSKEDERLIARGDLFEKWVIAKTNNKNIGEILERVGCKTIAIYGMADIGYLLAKELEEYDGIQIKYVIDKKLVYSDIPVKKFDDIWEPVDAIIVTVPHLFNEIKGDISKKCEYDVISLKELLCWG